jgi:hypothetical protein
MEENEISPLVHQDKILSELKQLKRLFTVLLGIEYQPAKEKFSRAALIRVLSKFKKMQAARCISCQNLFNQFIFRCRSKTIPPCR